MGIGRSRRGPRVLGMIGPCGGGPAVAKVTLLSSLESCSSALVDGGGRDARRDILVTRLSASLDVLPVGRSVSFGCYRLVSRNGVIVKG